MWVESEEKEMIVSSANIFTSKELNDRDRSFMYVRKATDVGTILVGRHT